MTYRPGKPFSSDDKIGQFLANSKKGVVYISFGTVIKSSLMSDQTKEIFRKMFLKFSDYDFIWKLDKGTIALLSHFDKVLAHSKFSLLKCENEVNPVAQIPWAT